jgi:hypothetical protein
MAACMSVPPSQPVAPPQNLQELMLRVADVDASAARRAVWTIRSVANETALQVSLEGALMRRGSAPCCRPAAQ